MLLSSSQSAALSNSQQRLLRVTTPNTNKHLLASQTRIGDWPGKLRRCRRQRRFHRPDRGSLAKHLEQALVSARVIEALQVHAECSLLIGLAALVCLVSCFDVRAVWISI